MNADPGLALASFATSAPKRWGSRKTSSKRNGGSVRVVNLKNEPFEALIGRPSKWGNPFSHLPGTQARFRVPHRGAAIAAYEQWIRGQPQLLADLPEIAGKVLGCHCAPRRCHGDVLIRLCIEFGYWKAA